MVQDPLDAFVQALLQATNMTSMPPEHKDKFVEEIRGHVDRRIGVIAMSELDKAGLEEFGELMEREPDVSQATIQEFFKGRIENFDQKVQAGLDEFAREFIAAAKKG